MDNNNHLHALVRFILIYLLVTLVSACDKADTGTELQAGNTVGPSAVQVLDKENNDKGPAISLLFNEWEDEVDPYLVRIIVTNEYMRIDDNIDKGDYILLDRKARKIYSIDHEAKRIIVIGVNDSSVKTPINLDLLDEKKDSKDIPRISNHTVLHYKFLTNGKLCHEAYVVPKLFDEALKARREYFYILASENAANLKNIPADIQEACDLSMNIFYPVRHLKYGFPIQETTFLGLKRQLVNYDLGYFADESLFKLPENYDKYSPRMMRGES